MCVCVCEKFSERWKLWNKLNIVIQRMEKLLEEWILYMNVSKTLTGFSLFFPPSHDTYICIDIKQNQLTHWIFISSPFFSPLLASDEWATFSQIKFNNTPLWYTRTLLSATSYHSSILFVHPIVSPATALFFYPRPSIYPSIRRRIKENHCTL